MQNLQYIDESIFIGMNDKYPSHLLPKGVFSSITNAIIDTNRITKRPGTDNVAAALGAFSILGLSAFEPAGGTKLIVACLDGSSNSRLHTWSGSGAFSAIGSANLTAGAQMNFVQASNSLFGFNGTDAVDYDGTTVTKNRANVPLGKFGIWFHNYLFVAGVSASPNRLYWSGLGTPTTFDTADFVDINANDGDEITGLSVLNDELIIFKRNSIWSISGWSGATFDATTIAGQNTQQKATGVGTISHQSIINTGRDLFYLSFNGSQPVIRSLTQTVFAKVIEEGIVSDEIYTTMDGLNKSQLSKTCGVYDGSRIHWAVPNAASTSNNLILVFDPDKTFRTSLGTMRSWCLWSGPTPSQYTVSTISGRAKVYFGDATTGGFVFEQGTSAYEDNGTAITMTVNTRDYMLKSANKSKWKYAYVKYESGSSGTLSFNARIDMAADFATQKSISLVGSSPGLGSFILGTSILGGSTTVKDRVTFAHLTGTLLGVQFKESTANSCEIYDYQIYGFPRGLKED